MALILAGRGFLSRLLLDIRPVANACEPWLQQQAAWHTTDSSSSTRSGAEQQAPGAADPFTRSLQSKTEQEVFSLLEKAKQQQQQQQDEEEDDDLIDVVNPETGDCMRVMGCGGAAAEVT
jgi:type III secretory pathway component EscR